MVDYRASNAPDARSMEIGRAAQTPGNRSTRRSQLSGEGGFTGRSPLTGAVGFTRRSHLTGEGGSLGEQHLILRSSLVSQNRIPNRNIPRLETHLTLAKSPPIPFLIATKPHIARSRFLEANRASISPSTSTTAQESVGLGLANVVRCLEHPLGRIGIVLIVRFLAERQLPARQPGDSLRADEKVRRCVSGIRERLVERDEFVSAFFEASEQRVQRFRVESAVMKQEDLSDFAVEKFPRNSFEIIESRIEVSRYAFFVLATSFLSFFSIARQRMSLNIQSELSTVTGATR